jgi:phosphopantothenoylcysteine decarboxylase/phosphopantothenate--cysteine ligase
MTESACRFVQPLTFQTLTRRPVHTSMWQPAEEYRIEHIALTAQADLMVIAPATANVLAKMACGIADDLVSTLALTAAGGACGILVAPAMNPNMLNAPATQANLRTLSEREVEILGPAEGRLACGDEGAGRMVEPVDILKRVAELLKRSSPGRQRPA